MKPLSFRQVRESINELSEEQLDMTAIIMQSDGECVCLYDHCLVSELPMMIYQDQDMDDNQPLLLLTSVARLQRKEKP